MCLSIPPPDSGTLVSKWEAKFALIRKEDIGLLSNRPVISFFSPGKTLLMLFVDKRNMTLEAHVQGPSVCGGSWCSNSSLSPLLVKLSHTFEWPFSWQSSPGCGHPCWLCTFFLLPPTFLLMCFDTALWENPSYFRLPCEAFPPCVLDKQLIRMWHFDPTILNLFTNSNCHQNYNKSSLENISLCM